MSEDKGMAGFNPTRAYQVLYDFEGTNEKELSISSGQILLSQDSPERDEDWIFVVKLINSQQRGFVPAGFLAPLSPPEAARYISSFTLQRIPINLPPSTPPPHRPASASYSTSPIPTSPIISTSPLTERHLLFNNGNKSNFSLISSRSVEDMPNKLVSQKRPTTPSSSAVHTSSPLSPYNPSQLRNSPTPPSNLNVNMSTSSVLEMFNKHESYLRQVIKQREEKFKDLEKSITQTGREIEKYKSLNDSLYQRILKLENTIETEHNKLKQRIMDEEKRGNLLSHSSVVF